MMDVVDDLTEDDLQNHREIVENVINEASTEIIVNLVNEQYETTINESTQYIADIVIEQTVVENATELSGELIPTKFELLDEFIAQYRDSG